MNVGIITASDKGYLGEREDCSGARIAEIMEAQRNRFFQTGCDTGGNKGSDRAGSAGNSHGNPAIFTDDHRAGDAVESGGGHPWRDTDRQSAG